LNSKGSRKVLTGDKSYGDVRSHENKKLREKISEVQYSIARYPDPKNGINNLEETLKKAVDDIGGMEHFVHDKDKVLGDCKRSAPL
jgi:hypothetical protein